MVAAAFSRLSPCARTEGREIDTATAGIATERLSALTRATALAQHMLTSTRSPRSTHEADTLEQEHRGGAAVRAAFCIAAGALGLTRNDLADALESGRTLSELAAGAGIPSQHLAGAIGDAIARADSRLSSQRAASIARQLVQGAPPVLGRHDADGDLDGA